MRAPIRPVRGGWPAALERRMTRWLWDDPRRLLSSDVTPDEFRKGMSTIHVGDTIKITGTNRHPDADALLIDNVDTSGRSIADVGASDGSTSVDLIAQLPGFESYVIADLFLTVPYVRTRRHLFVYDPAGTCILIAGRRALAWPSLSKVVWLAYRPLLVLAERRRGEREELLLLNPTARALIAKDHRVTYRVHDVFTVWQGSRPDVMKIANLLRRLYFSDDDILRALAAVHDSIKSDGYLLVVDNPRIPGVSARAGLYRRESNGFRTVAETEHSPEIGDLIEAFVPAAVAASTS